MKKVLHILYVTLVSISGIAQDSSDLPPKITINGYIKDLQTLSFNKNFAELVSLNLVHNRINAKWKPSERVTVAAEFRNRLYWGEEVESNPNFKLSLRNRNEKVNLQKTWINTPSLVVHTNVERLYFDFQGRKLKLRLGRQRINWGIATTWNPNDIFNVYNFLDFDYEERAGVDGANMKYTLSNSLSAELSYAHSGNRNGSIAALKCSFNKWNYDMQFITGWLHDRATVGTGWAGYIKDAGFKGEIQYLFRDGDSAGRLNMSLEGDYMFRKGWYMNLGLLFNNKGLFKSLSNWNELDLDLSSTNIMPTKWNMIVTAAKELSPLFSARMSTVYAPGTNLLIIFPSFQYNIATNWDLNLFWQSYFIELNDQFQSVNHRCFIQMKWSF